MSTTNDKIRWGILSTGAIAKCFAGNLAASKTGRLQAVASRDQSTADKFGDEFGVPKRYGRYEDLLADPTVDAVYIAPPHPLHAVWAIRAAEAKKHVLVEKPIAVNHAGAMTMIEAAIANNVFMMEAFMYRCHPQTAKLIELLGERAIGDVRLIRASFSFHAGFHAESRIFKNSQAGGGILDVGCYTVSMTRLIAGVATGKEFADPIDVRGQAHLGQTGVDEWAIADLRFPGSILAQLSTGVCLNQENDVKIFGTAGQITLPNPWVANRKDAEPGRIIVLRNNEPSREIAVDADTTAFSYEADVVGRAILSGNKQAPSPAMSWDDSLGNLRTLDRWRESIGLIYEFESPLAFSRLSIDERALARRASHNMKYGRIAGVDKPISRLVMGCDNQTSLPHAAVMFDDFFSRGGNTFDTAHIYGGGRHEEFFGQWLTNRGVRDDVVVISKGAHTPFCNPIDITMQLKKSLDRIKIDSAEIYLMHRDNPEIPVGEFIDVLNEHVRAGRIKVFGGSNWSLARVEEANAWAKQNGRQGFSVVSNNFSLARMVDPVWAGCITASDPESRAWLTTHQMPLLSWSSQARGFFLPGRAAPDKREDEELARCWYSQDNFARLARANELAEEKGVTPINISLAYVLHQRFPTYALIGPRTLSETRTSLPALDVTLTDAEVEWLVNGGGK
ncbi:MAG: aldo/keto reductase [Anaerolineae bacterium]|nr:aldo/keto reductase [Phycisphaerae bacterium]